MKANYEAVIGVWDGHDAGTALIIDGKVVLALNEERLSGRKLEVGMPVRALKATLEAAKGKKIAWAPTTSDFAKTLTRMCPSMKENYYQLRRRLTKPSIFHPITLRAKYSLTQLPTNDLLKSWNRHWFSHTLKVPLEDIFLIDHHHAHAASAAFWPKWNTNANIITLDGIGDGESGSVWSWNDTTSSLQKMLTIPGSASLGLFFEHITNELQMRPLEDEGKIMALATYAAEIKLENNLFLRWFSLTEDNQGFPILRCSIPATKMAKEIRNVIWTTPREHVCRMAQQTLEEIIPLFFKKIANATGIKTFGYSGGVASNIKVNRLIRNLPEVERLEICPAMGDGGLALGAALAVWQKVTGNKPDTFSDFKLGTDYGDLGKEAEKIAQETNSDLKLPTDIAQLTAEYIAKGEVVMWAQGRMELGARALGARSIIARADSTIARDDLNLRLKRRVWFQPFCPTILAEEAPKLLTDYRGPQDLNLHMTSGFLTTELGRKTLAGAIGPDGSCRPQMVENNPKDVWCNLLTHLQKLTGIGAIINTSLNMHGKPMANDTAGIVAAWLESDIQHLALGSAFLTKTPNTPKNDQR